MSIEDYWEDASVCIGGLPFSVSQTEAGSDHADSPITASAVECTDALSVRSHPKFQSNHPNADSLRRGPHLTSTRLPHDFPPPIALCSTVSIKQGGRFVLKDVSSILHPLHCPPLFAERRHGRLRLHLIESDQYCSEDNNCPLATNQVHNDSYIGSQEHRGLVQEESHFTEEMDEAMSTNGDMENECVEEEKGDSIANADVHVSPTRDDRADPNIDSFHEKHAARHFQPVEKHSCEHIGVYHGLDVVPKDKKSNDVVACRPHSEQSPGGRPSLEVGNDCGQSNLNSHYSSKKLLFQPCFAKPGTTIRLTAVS